MGNKLPVSHAKREQNVTICVLQKAWKVRLTLSRSTCQHFLLSPLHLMTASMRVPGMLNNRLLTRLIGVSVTVWCTNA